MSKKSRLRALKAKQLEEKKQLEEQEQLEKEKAKKGARSKAAQKYAKSAGRKEPKIYLILKLLMLVPYAVNCLFFGGITVIAVLFVGLNDIKASMAYEIVAAVAVITAGIVFEFLRKYILGFILCSAGGGVFLGVGVGFVSRIQSYMETNYVPPESANMDIRYMLYFYPSAIIIAASAALVTITLIRSSIKRKREKERYNNLPVKSIID